MILSRSLRNAPGWTQMKVDKEIRLYIDEEGKTQASMARSEKPEDELCDFCSGQQRPYKEYKCKDFHAGEGVGSLGSWNACPKCTALIDVDDREGLLDRVLLMGAGRIDQIPGVRDHFHKLFNLFYENRIQ